MTRLLSIVSLVLLLVLFPPAALALVSNNAVPGDSTYPIKRGLEDVIYKVVSLNPTTKAWFAAARSDRRFKEFTILTAQGKKTAEVLNELVEQTEIAARQITSVSDQGQKEKLVQKLSESIKKYDQGLKQLSSAAPTPASLSQNSLPPQIKPLPEETTAPAATIAPSARLTTVPTPASLPTVQPTPTSTPTPLSQDEQERQRQIEEARQKLEEIRRELEEQAQQRNRQQERNLQPEAVIPGQILPNRSEDKNKKKHESPGESRQEKKQSDKKIESKDRNLDKVVTRSSTGSASPSATSSGSKGLPKE